MFPHLHVRLHYFIHFEFPAVEKCSRRERLAQHYRRLQSAGSQPGQELWPGWMAERRSWGAKAARPLLSVPGLCLASRSPTQSCLPFRRSVSTGGKRALETISLGKKLHLVPCKSCCERFLNASFEVNDQYVESCVIVWHTVSCHAGVVINVLCILNILR